MRTASGRAKSRLVKSETSVAMEFQSCAPPVNGSFFSSMSTRKVLLFPFFETCAVSDTLFISDDKLLIPSSVKVKAWAFFGFVDAVGAVRDLLSAPVHSARPHADRAINMSVPRT